jgi:hypothetical protein
LIARREAIVRLGLGAAGLLAGGRRALFAGVQPALAALAGQLRAVPKDAAFDLAAKLIRSGVDWRTMLAAVFLCGVRGIRPRPHGILHCVMMVESAFQLAEASSPRDAWLPVLWNLHDFKVAQEENRRVWGDWELKPVAPLGDARRQFLAAMDSWDVERADRAIAGLVRTTGHSELFEILWPLMCRCYAFIGHKMIYAAQVERVVKRIGMAHAEPALRSLVMASLVSRNTTAFEVSGALQFPLQGRENPQESLNLHGDLRGLSPRQSQDRVVAAFREGLGPRTVWDALRLFASELFLRRRGRSASAGSSALLPVHAVTVVNALGHAYRSTQSERTKRLTILQAAAWLASLRDDLPVSMSGPPPPAAVSDWRPALFRKAQEHHQLKYAAAVVEESALAHPSLRPQLQAPAAEYLANPADPETNTYHRSLKALGVKSAL